MEERGTGRPVGWIRPQPMDVHVLAAYRRHGYATEAMAATLRHAFVHQHQPWLMARAPKDNAPAETLVQRFGFERRHGQCWVAATQWWRTQLRPPVRDALARLDAGLPPMRTERLWLRPPTPTDVEPLAAMRMDPAVMELMLDPPLGRRQAEAMERREMEQDARRLVIADPRTGEPLGWVSLGELVSVESPTVGYALRRSAWGQGFAAEATRRVVHYAVTEAACPSVEGVVFTGNKRSCRVLEKSGFALVRHGHYAGRDAVFYQLAA